jgi:hypothetical protein
MLAQIVKLYSSLKKEIVACIVRMALFHVLLYRRTSVVVERIKVTSIIVINLI